jgi:hypothetical protein
MAAPLLFLSDHLAADHHANLYCDVDTTWRHTLNAAIFRKRVISALGFDAGSYL